MPTALNDVLFGLTDRQLFNGWLIASAALFFAFYRWPGRKLDHIPTPGFSSHALSFFNVFEYLTNCPGLIQRGADKFKYSVFKIPTFSRWIVIVSGPKYIEELRKAPEDVLSFYEATNELLQVDYTLGRPVADNPYHVSIVRSQLTRSLPELFPSVHDEITAAFNQIIPAKGDEWLKVTAMETLSRVVCRTSNRIFVGEPLCHDPDYMDINLKFTLMVVKTAAIINIFPPVLHPLIGNLFTSVPKSVDRATKFLRPVIEERLDKIAQYGKNYPDKPLDMLSWLMDEAQGEERTVRSLTVRILTVNFAAIHTSTMTFTHVLFYLAAHPEYARELRAEIDAVVDLEGWSYSALNKMHKVDSFIRETQRLQSLSAIMMSRIAKQDFTFSDGTFIPKGTNLGVAIFPTHCDASNWSDPNTFQPFRHVRASAEGGSASGAVEGRKTVMTATHTDFLAFGHGRHACPGRFFAANELKLMLAHIVATYDVKLDGDRMPERLWIINSNVPNPKGKVLFRRREVDA